jgi:hypothetical protein
MSDTPEPQGPLKVFLNPSVDDEGIDLKRNQQWLIKVGNDPLIIDAVITAFSKHTILWRLTGRCGEGSEPRYAMRDTHFVELVSGPST